jgi:hypothetical protein
MCDDQTHPQHLTTNPVFGLKSDAVSIKELSTAERREMLKAVRAGDLIELDVDVVAFRAIYPNANYMRFYDEDLLTLATTFAGQPFLANHDTHRIDNRLGTIKASHLQGKEIFQTIKITTRTGLEAYLQGTIDRFSIGWYYKGVNCSICNTDWFQCNHWPGHTYPVGREDTPTVCELFFTSPTGKETSAVNVPAVPGTRVLSADAAPNEVTPEFAQLHAAKLNYQAALATKGTLISTSQDTAHPEPQATANPPEPIIQEEDPIMPTNDVNDQAPDAPEAVTQELTPPVVEAAPQAPNPAYVTQPQTQYVTTAPTQPMNLAQQTTAPARFVDPDSAVWTAAAREVTINGMLAQSGLPPAAMKAVRSSIRAGDSPDVIAAMIETQRDVIAALQPTQIVTGIKPNSRQAGAITGINNEVDKVRDAAFALFDNTRPKFGRKLSGLRELYITLSGDTEMTGRFMPDAVLTNITTATMPDLMAEWMNQRVVSIWSTYDKWFERLCRKESFPSLRDPHWIRVGGLGELATVGEGSPYTEKEWAAETETTNWTKRGNWLGITLEAIDRDQTSYIMQLPAVLTQSAWLTINKDFTRRLITANGAGYGYTMDSDQKALFHTDHSNLGSSALSVASWQATKLAMTAQKEYNTNEKLGALTLPRLVMIPRALEPTAINVFGSEQMPGGSLNDINPEVAGPGDAYTRVAAARNVYFINEWLDDANDWFAFANPTMMPLFGLGYRYGETPEIYSLAQSDQTSGMMFTNDVLPIKIRWYYSLGAIDWRGMYMQKVA